MCNVWTGALISSRWVRWSERLLHAVRPLWVHKPTTRHAVDTVNRLAAHLKSQDVDPSQPYDLGVFAPLLDALDTALRSEPSPHLPAFWLEGVAANTRSDGNAFARTSRPAWRARLRSGVHPRAGRGYAPGARDEITTRCCNAAGTEFCTRLEGAAVPQPRARSANHEATPAQHVPDPLRSAAPGAPFRPAHVSGPVNLAGQTSGPLAKLSMAPRGSRWSLLKQRLADGLRLERYRRAAERGDRRGIVPDRRRAVAWCCCAH